VGFITNKKLSSSNATIDRRSIGVDGIGSHWFVTRMHVQGRIWRLVSFLEYSTHGHACDRMTWNLQTKAITNSWMARPDSRAGPVSPRDNALWEKDFLCRTRLSTWLWRSWYIRSFSSGLRQLKSELGGSCIVGWPTWRMVNAIA
jgi:hypothetical protein